MNKLLNFKYTVASTFTEIDKVRMGALNKPDSDHDLFSELLACSFCSSNLRAFLHTSLKQLQPRFPKQSHDFQRYDNKLFVCFNFAKILRLKIFDAKLRLAILAKFNLLTHNLWAIRANIYYVKFK